MFKLGHAGLALVAAALFASFPVHAQQEGPGWFVPSQHKARPVTKPEPRTAPRPPPAAAAPGTMQPAPGPGDQVADQAPVQIPAPPIPALPVLPKTAAPPAAVLGVLGVPDVMRASTAAQEVERVIGGRREKLAQDAQKEQASWRDQQQAIANQRTKLPQDQLRARERDLQQRIGKAQIGFRDRNRIIQEAAQYSLGQIESTLIAVIRQVAESRNMNLVLHRSQVALNVNEFDITDPVAEQLNKILPSVEIPAENADPVEMAKKRAAAAATAQAAPAAGAVMKTTPTNGPSAVFPPAGAGGTAPGPRAAPGTTAPSR